jgi:hypothetical protein
MSAPAFGKWFGLCSALLLGLACSFDDGVNDAHGCDEQCVDCYLGYCLVTLEEAATAAGGSGGSGGSSGSAGSSGAGASGGAGGGSGIGGSGASSGGGGMNATGGTGAGGSPPAPCTDPAMASAERCNGVDDDCDGNVDEQSDVACYPAGTEGCVAGTDGRFECNGSCALGTQTCVAGVLGACSGFVGPEPELCGGAEAADENCNGSVDDTCACEGTESQRCYDGPAFSAGVGPCRAGRQTCDGGQFGACEGAVTPVAETCANEGADDNCNRRRDDVPNRGGVCVDFGKLGACFVGVNVCSGGALVCETPEPEPTETACDMIDEDCDGAVDEAFNLSIDEQNCGACGTRCAVGQQCCGGMCRSVDSDVAHCGACNDACASGEACCGGACLTTDTDDHCGACSTVCNANQDCCGGSCMNIDTSSHCGGCNSVCGDAQSCCSGMCVTPGIDNAHCGGCGITCPQACPCQAGECRDAMGLACL